MATANAQNLSGAGSGGDGGFFSNLSTWIGQAGKVTKDVGELYANVSPIWTGTPTQGVRNDPTFQGTPTPATTGSTDGAQAARNYTPLIIGGVGVLALFLFLK